MLDYYSNILQTKKFNFNIIHNIPFYKKLLGTFIKKIILEYLSKNIIVYLNKVNQANNEINLKLKQCKDPPNNIIYKSLFDKISNDLKKLI